MDFSEDDARTLHDILNWRRDVRHFYSDPLPDGTLDMLQNALELAPSVGNSRPWRVIRVQSASLRKAVREEFLRCNNEAASDYDKPTRQEYLRLKLAGIDNAPEQLAVFTVADPETGRGLGRQTMPATLHQSTAMAIHTMWLAARVHNIGMGMLSILDPRRMADLLEVPEGWEFTAYLCIGLTEHDDDTPLLHRVGWQRNTGNNWELR